MHARAAPGKWKNRRTINARKSRPLVAPGAYRRSPFLAAQAIQLGSCYSQLLLKRNHPGSQQGLMRCTLTRLDLACTALPCIVSPAALDPSRLNSARRIAVAARTTAAPFLTKTVLIRLHTNMHASYPSVH